MVKNSISKKKTVHFSPDNVDIVVEEGVNLLEAAINAGVHINASCGGAGICGTCKVLIEKGEVESTRTTKVSELLFAIECLGDYILDIVQVILMRLQSFAVKDFLK